MYDFKMDAGDKPTLYRDLAAALEALVTNALVLRHRVCHFSAHKIVPRPL